MDFKNNLNEHTKEVEKIIFEYLPKEEGMQKTVIEAMNRSVKIGGKRIRPMMMQEVFSIFGGFGRSIHPFMAAIEMIHTYSLIHDDLPALDNDDYRRGEKTCHIVYGEDMAILAGDALLNYAYEVALEAFRLEPTHQDRVIEALKVLVSNPGIYGMIGGQVADVELEGQDLTMEQILFIHQNKTSALMKACFQVGAIMAGAREDQVLDMETCGNKVGLAFQIQDDILDIIGEEKNLGKPVGSDEKNQKTTYVSLVGMEQAKEDVSRLSIEALDIMGKYSEEKSFLMNLIQYLIHRDN
ncbi:MAG: polyprenyl synthetase family protein [Anaerostipes sp.]|jgi:geranylgeranyl diphosphate synthase type II|nr:polyprenyl synthetase family protein [Anaerostipes sp.]